MPTIRIQSEDFDLGAECAALRTLNGRGNASIGGIASFVGLVRDLNYGDSVATLTLEHYPGMTERALHDIVARASDRWQIIDATVIHRIGTMKPTDQIVLVIVTSAHRADAFAACEFIMDYLKTEAPFWKKEITPQGPRWVDARSSDAEARERWETP